MNKYSATILSIICILSLAGCGNNDTHEIKITIPAGSTETFVYSDEEISPTGNTITISSGKDLGDTEVVLKTIEVKEENAYESTYLTSGMPVKMDVEKGAGSKSVYLCKTKPNSQELKSADQITVPKRHFNYITKQYITTKWQKLPAITNR